MNTARRLAAVLIAASAAGPSRAQGPPGAFTPAAGFAGRTEGNGSLRVLLGRPRPFHVESYGYDVAPGVFVLDQTVSVRGRPPLERRWVITTVGPGRYAATLTDAAGPAAGRTDGDRLFLRYRYRGPFVAHQTLTLRPDEATIDNTGTLTLLGVPVGRLRETITRKE